MRIGEVAGLAGVSAKAVRRYEALGLIAPRRTTNGYRDFDEYDVRLVREVRALRELGIPAERSRPFLECLGSGAASADECPSSLAEYRRAADELGARITELARRRALLLGRLHDAAHRGSAVRAQPQESLEPMQPPEPLDDGAAAHLPGLRLPPLTLPATDGSTRTLDALGPGRTVLYLYPLTGRPDVDLPAGWDTIPGARGCTAQACGFRDHHGELVTAGAAAVLGLSTQDTEYQREVVQRLRLPFPMLADPGGALATALDLPTFAAGGARLYTRLTMIVTGGVVEHVFYPVHPPAEHAGQVLDWLRTKENG